MLEDTHIKRATSTASDFDDEFYNQADPHNTVPRSPQVVDHVVENSNKSSSDQRLINYKVLIGKGINLNACDSTVHEDHASKVNSHKFNLPVIQFPTYQKQRCVKPMYKI